MIETVTEIYCQGRWWTITGIGLDIAGIGLLFYELFMSTSELGHWYYLRNHLEELEKSQRDISEHAEEIVEEFSSLLKCLPKNEQRKGEDLIRSIVGLDLGLSDHHIWEELSRSAANQIRTRIFIAAAVLIITGFVFQIVGAWIGSPPCIATNS